MADALRRRRVADDVRMTVAAAGHAAFAALVNAAGVVTSRPDQIRAVLGGRWEIIEV